MKRNKRPAHPFKPYNPVVRVIVDSSDGSKDRFAPLVEAKALYDQGILSFDLTNGHYCTNEKTPHSTVIGWARTQPLMQVK